MIRLNLDWIRKSETFSQHNPDLNLPLNGLDSARISIRRKFIFFEDIRNLPITGNCIFTKSNKSTHANLYIYMFIQSLTIITCFQKSTPTYDLYSGDFISDLYEI